MAEPIPYQVQSGENLMDIAKKLGLKDWHQLKEYHDSVSYQKTSEMPFAGATLMTPSQEEVYEMNGEEPPLDPVEEQKDAEQKQEEEKKNEEEEKKKEELSKGDHNGKYFVVHGAKCVCDKAVNPMQTSDLQVTSHKTIVLNDQSTKYLATEDDKTFIPPAATFGQCKLQPTSGGYLPCSFSPAPKWTKTYESTQVLGKKTLTEISELQCMIGGKITINKHGQTDSVSTAHADNTNPLELAAVNPAIEQPKKKEEYPVVTSIAITEIEDREGFKEKDSRDKPSIYLRKNEEASFRANLKSGNKQLTSWMVYSDHQGSKENRLLLKEQIGIEFSQSFGDLGLFRIEGYGKPKTPEYEKGKYDKCDPSCSIDLEVVENKLLDLEVSSNEFSSRIDPSKNLKFRKGVPSVIKAKFFIPRLTADEKARLKISLFDGDGNTLTDFITRGSTLTFTPKNSKATYTVVAQFTTETGEVIEKKITGESEGNVVLAISHGSEVVRPGTAMNFHVSKMRYSFDTQQSDYSLTSEESSEIKWNLDGVLIGTGNSLTIPGNKLTTPGKHVVEAYSKTANSTGKGAKKEDDDWHFEVKDNDVVSFKLSGYPKVGKPITAIVDKMVFADLQANEVIHWIAPLIKGTGKSVTVTPKVAGKFSVTCKINNQKGTTQEIDVLEARITNGFWHDLQGNEISKATWGQKVLFSIGGKNLKGENIKAKIIDKDTVSGDDFASDKSFAFGDTAYSNFALQLDKKVQDNTTSSLTPDASLFVKAQIVDIDKIQKDVPAKKGAQQYLSVSSSHRVYRALIGDSDGKQRHNPVDYDMKSFVYANTTFPKGSKLTVKIFEKLSWREKDKEATELKSTGTVKEDGTLVTAVDWGKLKDAKQNKKTKTYYPEIFDSENNLLFGGSDSETLCNAILVPQSILKKQVGYTGAVLVGSEDVPKIENENGVCECEARVRAFIRMLRVGEGTGELIKSSKYNKESRQNEIVYVDHDFQKGYSTAFGGNKIVDLSTHPMKDYGGSSAAGAYQIMKYTYAWLGGKKLEWTGKYFKILDIYEKGHDYRKMYQINDFQPESQDRLCVVIMKDKQKGLLELIINNAIEKAIRNQGSAEWASLPHEGDFSRHLFKGERQPATPMKICLEHYNKFYQEELKGISNLHLKKGFLKDFDVHCCDSKPLPNQEIESGSCERCHQDHYDIAKNENWLHQKPSECWQASIDILSNYGLKNSSGYPAGRIIMADQVGKVLKPKDVEAGLNYINSQLKIGNPVVVGLDDNLRQATYNSHKATEHFFVIVGAGCENGQRFYRFFDVGSPTVDQGTAIKNKLLLLENNLLQGKSFGGTHTYTVTEVRKNH